jgi:hypothetical protein
MKQIIHKCALNPNPCGWGHIWLPKLWRGISSQFQNSCIPRKTSREYILLSTFERKTVFLAIFKPKCARNRCFFLPFSYISGGLEVLFDFYDPPPPPPLDRALPRQLLALQAVLEPPMRSLAFSKCRSGASDYSRSMTQSLPLSYWSPVKSYTVYDF